MRAWGGGFQRGRHAICAGRGVLIGDGVVDCAGRDVLHLLEFLHVVNFDGVGPKRVSFSIDA